MQSILILASPLKTPPSNILSFLTHCIGPIVCIGSKETWGAPPLQTSIRLSYNSLLFFQLGEPHILLLMLGGTWTPLFVRPCPHSMDREITHSHLFHWHDQQEYLLSYDVPAKGGEGESTFSAHLLLDPLTPHYASHRGWQIVSRYCIWDKC